MSRRRGLLRVLARWVKGWAESVLEEEAPRVPRPPASPPVSGNGTPPAHWLQLVQSARRGPPADWVERVRKGAPHLLERLEAAPSPAPPPRGPVALPRAPVPAVVRPQARSPEPVLPAREPLPVSPPSPRVERVPRVHLRPESSRGAMPAPRESGPVPATPSPEETTPRAVPRAPRPRAVPLRPAIPTPSPTAEVRPPPAQAPRQDTAVPAPSPPARPRAVSPGTPPVESRPRAAVFSPVLPPRSLAPPAAEPAAPPRDAVSRPAPSALPPVRDMETPADMRPAWPEVLEAPANESTDTLAALRDWERLKRLEREQRGD